MVDFVKLSEVENIEEIPEGATILVETENEIKRAPAKEIGAVYKIGDIKSTVRTDVANNWLLCNGDTISRDDYPDLAPFLSEAATPIINPEVWFNDGDYLSGFMCADGKVVGMNYVELESGDYIAVVYYFDSLDSTEKKVCYINPETNWVSRMRYGGGTYAFMGTGDKGTTIAYTDDITAYPTPESSENMPYKRIGGNSSVQGRRLSYDEETGVWAVLTVDTEGAEGSQWFIYYTSNLSEEWSVVNVSSLPNGGFSHFDCVGGKWVLVDYDDAEKIWYADELDGNWTEVVIHNRYANTQYLESFDYCNSKYICRMFSDVFDIGNYDYVVLQHKGVFGSQPFIEPNFKGEVWFPQEVIPTAYPIQVYIGVINDDGNLVWSDETIPYTPSVGDTINYVTQSSEVALVYTPDNTFVEVPDGSWVRMGVLYIADNIAGPWTPISPYYWHGDVDDGNFRSAPSPKVMPYGDKWIVAAKTYFEDTDTFTGAVYEVKDFEEDWHLLYRWDETGIELTGQVGWFATDGHEESSRMDWIYGGNTPAAVWLSHIGDEDERLHIVKFSINPVLPDIAIDSGVKTYIKATND